MENKEIERLEMGLCPCCEDEVELIERQGFPVCPECGFTDFESGK